MIKRVSFIIVPILLVTNALAQIEPGARQISLSHSDIALSNDVFSLFNNGDNKDFKLKLKDSVLYPSPELLEENLTLEPEVKTIDQKHHAKDPSKKNKIYRLEDHDGTEISAKELVKRYLSNPEICFFDIKPPEYENII